MYSFPVSSRRAADGGRGGKMGTVDNLDLARWRDLQALEALRLFADHVKVDHDFKPVRAAFTQRVHISAAGSEWELLVDGPKFYDTRAQMGGGGAVDLVMHLWQVPFKQAVAILRNVGA